MPTFRQLVTSNPGSAWMRGQNQTGYGGSTQNAPGAVSSPFMYNWNDPQAQPQLKPMQPYQSRVDPNDAWAKATEYRVNLMQQNPEYFAYGQARPQGSRQVHEARQSNANFFQGMANRNGGSWQSTPQDYLRRADQQQASRFAQEGGPAAQWGWDQGSATWQPQNQSARNATFGSLAGPSASYQAAMNAQQQAYAGPAQQAARTRQMIYGYGG